LDVGIGKSARAASRREDVWAITLSGQDSAQLTAKLSEIYARVAPDVERNNQASAFNAMLISLRAFSTYVPRSLVAKLVRTGEIGIAEPREAIVTVMFTDIAGFTTLSEQMGATAAARLLNLFDRTKCWCPSRPSPQCRSKIENRPQALTLFCRPILGPLRHLGIHCPKIGQPLLRRDSRKSRSNNDCVEYISLISCLA
jgi:hypothetical protein